MLLVLNFHVGGELDHTLFVGVCGGGGRCTQ